MNVNKGQPPSIVFAISSMTGGGAERVVLDLINHWPDERYRPVLLLAWVEGEYLEYIASHVKVISLDIPKISFRQTFSVARRIREQLAEYNPVAVIAHLNDMNRLMLRARKLGAFSAPLTVVEHNNIGRMFATAGRSKLANAVAKREMAWLYSGAHAVVGVSQGVVDDALRQLNLKQGHVHVINNPVDFDKVQAGLVARPNDSFAPVFECLPRPIILSAGRLHPQKAFDDLIRAFALIPAKERGSLVILGQGVLEDDLNALARSLDVTDHVHLPGFTMNPWWYMARADLFAMSSHWEGYPMILLEALASGLSIVATDCDYGPREILTKEYGRLVPVGDPKAMAEAFRAVLAKSVASPVAHDVRAYLEQFRPATVAQSYIDLAVCK